MIGQVCGNLADHRSVGRSQTGGREPPLHNSAGMLRLERLNLMPIGFHTAPTGSQASLGGEQAEGPDASISTIPLAPSTVIQLPSTMRRQASWMWVTAGMPYSRAVAAAC